MIAGNAIGLVTFLRLHADALLAAGVDTLNPDWGAMRVAFGAYTVFAVALLSVASIGVAALVRWVWERVGGAPSRRVAAAALALGLTAGVVLVLVDVLIFQDYGIHFYEFNVVGILGDAALRRDLGIQPAQVLTVSIAAAVLLGIELAACALAMRVRTWPVANLGRASAVALLVAIPAALGAFAVAEDRVAGDRTALEEVLPLGPELLLRERMGPHIATVPRLGRGGYATAAADSVPTLARRPNIVFFVPDGLRADMVTPTLAPNLTAFGERTDVMHSRRHFSTGHVSEAGIFGLLYGVDAQAYHAFLDARVPAYPIEVLRRNGYRTLLIASSRLNPYPSDQLLRLFDDVEYPANDDAALATLGRFVDARRRDGVPYFVVAFIYTPHYPFTSAKPAFRRYPLVGPSARTNYMNDVLQADDYFRQTFELVRDDYAHGRTIVLATSDHGEEIRDHGVFGHAPTTFWNEKVLVPFFLGLPGTTLAADARRPERSSHVDVWPTIFDYLGVAGAMPAASYSDGTSLLRQPGRGRPVYVYGRYFPEADRPSAVVDGDRKYWFRVAGVAEHDQLCSEITRVTDLDDRPASLDTAAATAALTALQSDFWHFLRQPGGTRPANCTSVAASFHGAGDAAGNRLSEKSDRQRGRAASRVRAGPAGP